MIYLDGQNLKSYGYTELAPKLLEIHYQPEDDNQIEILNEIEEVKSQESDEKDEKEQYVINMFI